MCPREAPNVTDPIHALVWAEGSAAEEEPDTYPNDVNAAISAHLNEDDDFVAKTASLTDVHHGMSEPDLAWADVVLWWGHRYHGDVPDGVVERIERHIAWHDLGFIALHSAHYSKPFTSLIGATGDLGEVRNNAEAEHIEVRTPDHPIAEGVDDFTLPKVEMYGEPFDVPDPDTVVFHSTFEGGGEFRSGITFDLDSARCFYFRPGHEEFRLYHRQDIRQILANATRWAAGRD